MAKVTFRKHFDYDVEAASDEATIKDQGKSLTVQSMSEDADINVLMHRFGVTGKMPESVRLPEYGDYSEVTDYRSALDAIREAERDFMRLPAKVRAEFDNDPQKLLQFVMDDGNMARAVELGLMKEGFKHGQAGKSSGDSGDGGSGKSAGGSAGASPGAGSAS